MRGNNRLVLGIGVIIVTSIIAIYSERLTVGEAEALGLSDYSADPFYECDVQKTCNRWAYGWWPQHQRVQGEVKTVEVREWRCVHWTYRGTPPECEDKIRP